MRLNRTIPTLGWRDWVIVALIGGCFTILETIVVLEFLPYPWIALIVGLLTGIIFAFLVVTGLRSVYFAGYVDGTGARFTNLTDEEHPLELELEDDEDSPDDGYYDLEDTRPM